MNALSHAESLIERRSANQALLESLLGECVNELRQCASVLYRENYTEFAAEVRAVASRSSDALRTIAAGEQS